VGTAALSEGSKERAPVEDRAEQGRAVRKRVPRSSHGDWAPSPSRRDPVAILEEQSASRIPELVPIRYGRMASSPFAFYRGAAAVMAEDLAAHEHTGITAQICGDAHLLNFGIYKSPERRLVFDLNDFDETLPGPWEWDLKRLVASLVIAGQENGYSHDEIVAITRDTVGAYRTSMTTFATMDNLALWYAHLEVEQLMEAWRSRVAPEFARRADKRTAKFASRDNLQAFQRLTEQTDDGPRFRSQPPLVVRADELPELVGADVAAEARRVLAEYLLSLSEDRRHLASTYRYVDLARKVVGVGSVGTRAWIVLLLGHDENDPLVLQVKQAQESVLERHLGASGFDGHGHRVVTGQRLMQASSDIFLGWYHGYGIDREPRDFYVRQLRDGKGGIDTAAITANQMRVYGEVCAWTLARAHARSGDRVAIAAYCGTSRRLDEALTAFGFAYAEQNARDHAALVAAVADGRIEAVAGV
jgi:uncharacterized protein (DUF2252 family)